MTVDAVNVKLSVIEQIRWVASASKRLGYLDELAQMAGALEMVTGPQAADAQSLTRRLCRVVRHIPGPGVLTASPRCRHGRSGYGRRSLKPKA